MLGGKTVIKKWGILGDPGADSGGKGKTKRVEKMARRKVKNVLYFSSRHFFHPFSLSLAPTICPWVSEDASFLDDRLTTQHSHFFNFFNW